MAKTVDMTPVAVTRRVREVAELYEVGVRLAKAKRRGPTPLRQAVRGESPARPA